MNRFVIILVLLLAQCQLMLAQSADRCKAAIKRNAYLVEHPEMAVQCAEMEASWAKWIEKEYATFAAEKTVVTLPIVVHVLWYSEEQNISDEQIQSQIEVLNEDFRKMNSNLSMMPAAFANDIADVEFEFCLASLDPNGNATNGITRREVEEQEIGESENYYSTAAGGQDPWDNDKYINIWVAELEEGSLGFAYFPGQADPPQADGIVIASPYFGRTGTAVNSTPLHLGRTATHELGHYFGLEHIWGPSDESHCNEDDGVNDTPSQYESSGGCNTFPYTDDCTPSGNGIMFMNYMDYSDDACAGMFTEGQKARMIAVLNNERPGLLSSAACGMVAAEEVAFEQMQITPNPARNWIEITTASATGKAAQLRIYDLSGRVISEQKFTNTPSSISLTINNLQNGVHFVELQFENTILRSKLLINN